MRRLTSLFVVALCAPFVCAQQHPCTSAEAKRAEVQSEKLRSWRALYRSYQQYQQCDDGAISEGYSESVARILVDHWSSLPRLADLAKKDPGFQQFVLKHVDATDDIDDLNRVKKNAETQCPPGLKAICAELAKQAEGALRAVGNYGASTDVSGFLTAVTSPRQSKAHGQNRAAPDYL